VKRRDGAGLGRAQSVIESADQLTAQVVLKIHRVDHVAVEVAAILDEVPVVALRNRNVKRHAQHRHQEYHERDQTDHPAKVASADERRTQDDAGNDERRPWLVQQAARSYACQRRDQ